MIAGRRFSAAAPAWVLLGFVGLWIGHTLEYLRVWGSDGVASSMASPVHAYMLPVGVVLAGAGAVVGVRLWRAWRALGHRLDRAVAAVRGTWRGRSASAVRPATAQQSPGTRLAAIWLPLAALQIALYLIQENLEALARAQPAPGWGAITGIHWAAPFVHLYVALVLSGVIRICQILVRRRTVLLERVEGLVRVAILRLRGGASVPAAPVRRTFSPLDCFGLHLWRRPPPHLHAA